MGNRSSIARRMSAKISSPDDDDASASSNLAPKMKCCIVRNGTGPRALTCLHKHTHKSTGRDAFAYFLHRGSFHDVHEIAVSAHSENGAMTRCFSLFGCQHNQKRFISNGGRGAATLKHEFTLVAKWKLTDTSAADAGDTILRLRCAARNSERNYTVPEYLGRSTAWEIVWEYPLSLLKGGGQAPLSPCTTAPPLRWARVTPVTNVT